MSKKRYDLDSGRPLTPESLHDLLRLKKPNPQVLIVNPFWSSELRHGSGRQHHGSHASKVLERLVTDEHTKSNIVDAAHNLQLSDHTFKAWRGEFEHSGLSSEDNLADFLRWLSEQPLVVRQRIMASPQHTEGGFNFTHKLRSAIQRKKLPQKIGLDAYFAQRFAYPFLLEPQLAALYTQEERHIVRIGDERDADYDDKGAPFLHLFGAKTLLRDLGAVREYIERSPFVVIDPQLSDDVDTLYQARIRGQRPGTRYQSFNDVALREQVKQAETVEQQLTRAGKLLSKYRENRDIAEQLPSTKDALAELRVEVVEAFKAIEGMIPTRVELSLMRGGQRTTGDHTTNTTLPSIPGGFFRDKPFMITRYNDPKRAELVSEAMAEIPSMFNEPDIHYESGGSSFIIAPRIVGHAASDIISAMQEQGMLKGSQKGISYARNLGVVMMTKLAVAQRVLEEMREEGHFTFASDPNNNIMPFLEDIVNHAGSISESDVKDYQQLAQMFTVPYKPEHVGSRRDANMKHYMIQTGIDSLDEVNLRRLMRESGTLEGIESQMIEIDLDKIVYPGHSSQDVWQILDYPDYKVGDDVKEKLFMRYLLLRYGNIEEDEAIQLAYKIVTQGTKPNKGIHHLRERGFDYDTYRREAMVERVYRNVRSAANRLRRDKIGYARDREEERAAFEREILEFPEAVHQHMRQALSQFQTRHAKYRLREVPGQRTKQTVVLYGSRIAHKDALEARAVRHAAQHLTLAYKAALQYLGERERVPRDHPVHVLRRLSAVVK